MFVDPQIDWCARDDWADEGERLAAVVACVVTFSSRSPEAMPSELAAYLRVLSELARRPVIDQIRVRVEPHLDGPAGRWLNLTVDTDEVSARLWAGSVSDHRPARPGTEQPESEAKTWRGWVRQHYDNAGPRDPGFWARGFGPVSYDEIAQCCLQALHLRFGLFRPQDVFLGAEAWLWPPLAGRAVDLRAMARKARLPVPPPVRAPRRSEIGRLALKAGRPDLVC